MIAIYRNNMPPDWDEDELRKVTLRKRGYSWAKEDESERADADTVPVLRIPNIQQELDLTDLLYLRNVSDEALRESAVEKGWILFVGSNGNPDRIGDSALMNIDRPMVFASFLMGMASSDPQRITPEFLACWLRLHSVHQAFSKTSQQTTGLANFSWSAVKRSPIRFPKDLCEQRQITHILETVDRTSAATRAKLAAALTLRTGLMQELFTRGISHRHSDFKRTKIGLVPDSWDVVPLGRCATVVSGIALNNDREARFHPRQYLTVINVQRERLDLSEVRYMEVYPHEMPDALLERGDIVVVEGHANPSEIGRAALITEKAAGCAYQNHLFRVRLLPDAELNPLFLLGELNSERVRRHWVATCNTSSGLNTINHRGLRRLLIQRPKPEEQEDIAAMLRASNDSLAACNAEVLSIDQLKRSLLQNLLTGRVRARV